MVNPGNTQGGVLGYLGAGGGIAAGLGFNGATGADPNNDCGCLPPDTNAAVGGSWIVETVNTEFVVFDKATGTELFSETLNSLFAGTGQQSEGDVYVVYDPLANRWYVDSIDSNNNADLLFAVSNDGNPLDGFSNQYLVPIAAPGDLADFPKFGYNADYITFSANDFGAGYSAVTVVNKAAALAGTLTYVQLSPSPQFRALVPAQDTTAHPGDPIWFVGSAYLNQGETNNVIRVTELTNPFTSPVFTDYYVTVDTYGGYAASVDQPGGLGTVAANDNTTTQVFEYNGELVTAIPASTAADGYYYPKVHYYEFNVSSGTPALALQGVIDPGAGVAAFFPTVAMNPTTGDLGLTWMQSSASQFVSMWVGTVSAATGAVAVYDATPNAIYEYASFRNGDYSTVVYDPGTNSFWAANEYAGPDNGSVTWDTYIQQFSPSALGEQNWYTIDVPANSYVDLETFIPNEGGTGQFLNDTLSVGINLYDANGNLVASGTELGDGRTQLIYYPTTGLPSQQYTVQVFNMAGTGEYFLGAQTTTYTTTSVSGDVFNDLLGFGTNAGYPGLNGWTVELLDSSNNVIATQLTHTINGVDGSFSFQGLDPGQYTVEELVQAGWEATTPADVAVDTTGGSVTGIEFGDFQFVTISGTLFNDLAGSGSYAPGDPGLAGWTVELVDYYDQSIVYATATTDSNGYYEFDNVGGGTYAILQTIQAGWIQTDPPSSEYYAGYVVSGGIYGGLDYGDFQLVTYSGTVYNDVTGNGVDDGGDTGLAGWTVNLYDSSNSLIASATTAGDGSYSFSNLGPGSYTISEVTPSGWIITQPGSPYAYTETATSGDSLSTLSFGNFKLATFSGQVFNDLNANGVQDKGDVGMPAWTVELLTPGGNVVATTVTNKSGNFSFTGIYPGNFQVAEIVNSGWYQTTTPVKFSLASTSGEVATGLNFGDHKGTPPSAPGGGSGGGAPAIGGISIVPTVTTNLSVPSGYTKTGPSAVVVPLPPQTGPVNVVYNDVTIASKDDVMAAIESLFESNKKVTEDDVIAILASSLLTGSKKNG